MSPIAVSKRICTGVTVGKPFDLHTAKRARLEYSVASDGETEKPQEYEPLNK